MSQIDACLSQSDYYEFYNYEEEDEYRSDFFSSLWSAEHQNENEMYAVDCISKREKYSKSDAVNKGFPVAVCDTTVFDMAKKVMFFFSKSYFIMIHFNRTRSILLYKITVEGSYNLMSVVHLQSEI